MQGDRILHSDTLSGTSPDSSLLQDVARVSIEQCQIGRYSSRYIGCGSILIYGRCIFGVLVYNRQKFDTQSGERDWTINRPFPVTNSSYTTCSYLSCVCVRSVESTKHWRRLLSDRYIGFLGIVCEVNIFVMTHVHDLMFCRFANFKRLF